MTGKSKRAWRGILIDHTEQAIHSCLISALMKDFGLNGEGCHLQEHF